MSIRDETGEDRDYLMGELASLQRQDLVKRVRDNGGWLDQTEADMLNEAVERFRRGDRLDGLTSVERALMPKWSSAHASESAYWRSRRPTLQAAA